MSTSTPAAPDVAQARQRLTVASAAQTGAAAADPVLARWQERIRAARAAKGALRLRGGGSKDFLGEPPSGEIFDTTEYRGIVDYDPTELVITARCGTPLAEVEATMRERGQMLAFEPPHFGAATFGGCVAAGLSGPRRPYAGAVRDLVLGVRVLDGRGEDLRFGGQVMKNVAGFDLPRLLAGSLGTLALISEASLKCIPLPRIEATRGWECSSADAIRRVNEWSGRALPISASAWDQGRLVVRFSGARAAVEAALGRLGGESLADADAWWQSLREQSHPFFTAQSGVLWRLSVRATAPDAPFDGGTLIEWGGAQRWFFAPAGEASRIRAWATAHGGHASIFRGGEARSGVFQPLSPALAALHRRLAAAFDPEGVFDSGRLYPDL